MKTYKISRSGLALSILIMLLSLVYNTVKGQQNAQWPFYIAFEDAIGAKDTIWMVFDSSATEWGDLDPHLGEIPQIVIDSSLFRVWVYRDHELNEYNTNARNIISYSFNQISIYAANYELPIIARWDSSLFAAGVLYEYGDRVNWAVFDNEYFFGYHSDDGFNLLLDDHAIMPGMPDFWWGSGNHFPSWVDIQRGPYPPLSVGKINDSDFSIYPNPTNSEILISFSKVTNANLRIYNANGVLVKTGVIHGDQKRIDLKGLSSGLYFVEIKDENGSVVKKVVVNK